MNESDSDAPDPIDIAVTHIDDHLLVYGGDVRWPVPIAEIAYIESDEQTSRLHLADGRTLSDRRSLKTLEALLLPRGFQRVHRTIVVNLRQIFEIRRKDSARGWDLRLRPPLGTVLPVSRTYLGALWKAYAP